MKGCNHISKAVITALQRTPIGKIKKSLAGFGADQLAAMAAKKVVEKAGIDPALIDDAIIGNLFNFNNINIARKSLIIAGFPLEVPALTIDRQCGSSLNAAAYAAMLIECGNADIVLTGGVESYSQKPLMLKNPETAYPGTIEVIKYSANIPEYDVTMIQTAENIAKKYSISREDSDAFALRSHINAARAWNEGLFAEQVFPVEIPQRNGDPIKFEIDECVRFDASLESMAKLKPVVPGGIVTAGNASPMNDGAAMVMVMSEKAAKEHNQPILAKIAGFASAGVDPLYMGLGPIPATKKLLAKAGLTVDDIDLFEINEAFAAQTLACMRELKIPEEKLNVNGGAIAIGHPNASSGAVLIGRIVHEMQRRDAHRGIVTFCCGGGLGFSLLLERD